MKRQLFILPAVCLLLSGCEMERVEGPGKEKGAPREQVESEADRGVTQRIRQALMDDDSLSTNAKNIKIITANGVVILRGTVNSEKEKGDIGKKAKDVTGVKNVDNQLETAGASEQNS